MIAYYQHIIDFCGQIWRIVDVFRLKWESGMKESCLSKKLQCDWRRVDKFSKAKWFYNYYL